MLEFQGLFVGYIFHDQPLHQMTTSPPLDKSEKMEVFQSISIDSMPKEICDQIIRSISVTDLPHVMLSSRALYRQAQPHLYRSIYYLVRSTPPSPDAFPLLRSYTRAYDPEYSAQIIRPYEFLRTITESPFLRPYIDKVSLSIQESSDEGELEALIQCFSIPDSSTLHLALENKNVHLALASTVTSLDIVYPAEDDLEDLQDSLRDQIYSLFDIPSLRHLCLRDVRCWNAFSPIPDNTRVGTSNVVSLTLPNTVPMDTDLQEILTWPKGLKCIHHESRPGLDNFFQKLVHARGKIASPERFLQGIASQRESLEEVDYNNGVDCCGTDESTFSPALMSEFTKLRSLSVPQECFVYRDRNPHLFYTVLPPNLEELYLDQDGDIGDDKYEAQLREWMLEVVDHKEECFPSLKTVVLWQWEERCRHFRNYRVMAPAVCERLYVLFHFRLFSALIPE
jgi:hypothetical protein